MLVDCGLDLVELGHSERREHFGETDRTVGLKTEAAVRHGLVPLICVGETLAEREQGRAEAVLTAQTQGALQFLDADQKSAPRSSSPTSRSGRSASAASRRAPTTPTGSRR